MTRLSRLFGGALLAAAILAAPPAHAQQFGAGISFLGDQRGAGFLVDYSQPLASQSGDNIVGWVAEFGLNHKGIGNALVGDFGITTIMLQGGLRLSGEASDKFTWQAQGLVGLMRSSFGASPGALARADCERYNIDCSVGASDTGGVLTIGGGLLYELNDRTGLRGQIDIPIAIGSSGGATSRFAIMLVFKR